MDTSSFIEQLFTSFLGRKSDDAGMAYWLEQIDSKALNAAEVTENFIESAEFTDRVAPIARLYYATFDRIPDAEGLSFWVTAHQDGSSIVDISNGFIQSDEFIATYGGLTDNGEFIELLYKNVMGRAADEEGKAYWLDAMSNGVNRAEVVNGFANSQEFATATNDAISVILKYHGILGTQPSMDDINNAIVQNDPVNLITQLYADESYSGATVPYLTKDGVVVDGYVAGATVFIDTNGDGILNEGEVSTTTDELGNFDFGENAGFGTLVMSGGTDISTGKDFEGTMTAPSGSTVVNPITTLINQVSQDNNSTPEEAADAVANALGIDNNVDLLNYDPINEASRTDATEEETKTALQVHTTATQLNTLVSQSAALLDGAGITDDETSGINATYESLAEAVNNEGAVDLTSNTVIDQVIKGAANQAGADSSQKEELDDLSDDAAQTITNLNQAIEDASNSGSSAEEILVEIASVQIVAEDIEDEMESGAESGDVSDTTDSTEGDEFDDAVNSAGGDVGDVDGDSDDDGSEDEDDGATTSGGGGGGGSSSGDDGNTTAPTGPVITSADTISPIKETSGPNQVIYQVTSDDENAIYSLSGDDAALLEIDENTGKVTLKGNPDYEDKSSYAFTVTATDESNETDSQDMTLDVEDVTDVELTYEDGEIHIDGVADIGEIKIDNVVQTDVLDITSIGINDAGSGAYSASGVESLTLNYGVTGENRTTISLAHDNTEILTIALDGDGASSTAVDANVYQVASLKYLNLVAQGASQLVLGNIGLGSSTLDALESIYIEVSGDGLTSELHREVTNFMATSVSVSNSINANSVGDIYIEASGTGADASLVSSSTAVSVTGDIGDITLKASGNGQLYGTSDPSAPSYSFDYDEASVSVGLMTSTGGGVGDIYLEASGTGAGIFLSSTSSAAINVTGDIGNVTLKASADGELYQTGDSSFYYESADVSMGSISSSAGSIGDIYLEASGTGSDVAISGSSGAISVAGEIGNITLKASGDGFSHQTSSVSYSYDDAAAYMGGVTSSGGGVGDIYLEAAGIGADVSMSAGPGGAINVTGDIGDVILKALGNGAIYDVSSTSFDRTNAKLQSVGSAISSSTGGIGDIYLEAAGEGSNAGIEGIMSNAIDVASDIGDVTLKATGNGTVYGIASSSFQAAKVELNSMMLSAIASSAGGIGDIYLEAAGTGSNVLMNGMAGAVNVNGDIGTVTLKASGDGQLYGSASSSYDVASVSMHSISSSNGSIDDIYLEASGEGANVDLTGVGAGTMGDITIIASGAVSTSAMTNDAAIATIGNVVSGGTDHVGDGNIGDITITVGADADASNSSTVAAAYINSLAAEGNVNSLTLQALGDYGNVWLNGSDNSIGGDLGSLTITASGDSSLVDPLQLEVGGDIADITISATGAGATVGSSSSSAISLSATEDSASEGISVNSLRVESSGDDSAVYANLYLDGNGVDADGSITDLDAFFGNVGSGSSTLEMTIEAADGVGVDDESTAETEIFYIEGLDDDSTASFTIDQEENAGIVSVAGSGTVNLTYTQNVPTQVNVGDNPDLVTADINFTVNEYMGSDPVSGDLTISTGSGEDVILLGNSPGNNTIDGGGGADVFVAGVGIDSFIFREGSSSSVSGSEDQIQNLGVGDIIDLTAINGGVINYVEFGATPADTTSDGFDVVYDRNTTTLFYETSAGDASNQGTYESINLLGIAPGSFVDVSGVLTLTV